MSAHVTLRQLVLSLVGIAALVATLLSVHYSVAKASFFSIFGQSSNNETLASASCDLPASNEEDVYFVSCGGFF